MIAPYHAQCLKLRAGLRNLADAVKVGSVEEFQGQVGVLTKSTSHLLNCLLHHFPVGTESDHHIDGSEQQRICDL